MKLWQLVAIMDKDVQRVQAIALSNAEWHQFATWLGDDTALVQTQDRAKLDAELPISLVQTAMATIDTQFYLSKNGVIQSKPTSREDEVLSAMEVVARHGADVLEEVCEYGSASV